MIDIDRSKAINDRHGHPGGDEVLRTLAKLYRAKREGRDRIVSRTDTEEDATCST